MHCAACALALQEKLNEMDEVSVQINFVTKVLVAEISTEKPEETFEVLKENITKFDHAIQIFDYEDEEDAERKERQEMVIKLIRFVSTAAVMLLNLLIPVAWLKISIFAVLYLIAAYDVIYDAFINVFHGKIFDEKFLMTIASLGAFAIGEFIEAISVMILYGIGEILEDIAISGSRRKIEGVLKIKQPYANLIDGEEEVQTDLSAVKVGDLIRVKPGERVPLDGEIVEGTSYLDMSALTGETREKIVQPGDEVLSGSINGSSVLVVRVTKLEAESTVSKVVDMVQNATETKARSEKYVAKFAKIYTPVVLGLALVMFLLPNVLTGFANVSVYAYRALSFLVVSCPCALVISVPLSYFTGVGALARNGVLVKGANFLEELSLVDTVIFDKTGTLTEGNFEITEVYEASTWKKEELVEIAAYAESFSNHRIAKSIKQTYDEMFKEKPINSAWINGYEEIAGLGIKANIFMQDTLVGNAKLLKQNDINFVEVDKPGTIIYIAINGKFAGYIVIADMVKADSKRAIEQLKELKIKNISLCTGDDKNVAKDIAEKLGLTNYYANLLPDEKFDTIYELIKSGRHVAFVGDGINDAPALANANVGLSMGGVGSDIAVESSDIVIMTDEPSKVAETIKKAKQTKRIVRENVFGSIFVKVVALGLISVGLTGMWLAVFADVGVTFLAILNSLRLILKDKRRDV